MSPRKKKTTVEEEVAEPAVVAEDFGEVLEGDLPPDVLKVMDDLGEDVGKVVLYRRLAGEKQAYLTTIDADEFSLDLVASLYGGGRYLARLTRAAGGFIKGVTFRIDESIKPTPKGVEGSAAATGGGDRDLLLKIIDKLGAGNPAQKDPMEIAAALAASSSQQAQATMTAMMGVMAPLLAKITELSAGGGKGGSMQDLLAAIQLGSEMGGDGDSYLPVIREVGVPLVRALETELARRNGRPNARALPPASIPKGAPMPVADNPPAGPALPPWAQAVAGFIPKLADYAAHGVEPNAIAAVIDAQYPRLAAWLEEAVEHPQFVEQLTTYFPVLAPHRTWIANLCAQFLVEEDGGEESHTSGEEPVGPTHDDEPGEGE